MGQAGQHNWYSSGNHRGENPFRYRGYYYDDEIELYYLNQRYYNPEWSRFINADTLDTLTATPSDLTDKNLFAYCDNNSVMQKGYKRRVLGYRI